MNGGQKEGVRARGEVATLLLRDGALSEAELRHVERVQAKLPSPRPVVPLLLELGLVSGDVLRATLQAHRLGLRIGALLVELGHLSESDLAKALSLQEETEEPGRRLGEILVELGLLGAQQLAEVLSSQLGVPCAPPGRLAVDPALAAAAPLELCRRHRFLPLRSEGGRVCVAFADPLEKADAAAAQTVYGADLAPWIVTACALEEALEGLELTVRVVADGATRDRTAVATLHEILDVALRDSASAVHLEPGPDRVVVRLRRDGVLSLFRELPAALAAPLLRRLEREAGVETEEGAPHREGWIRLEREERILQLRASFLASARGESVVLRLRDPERRALALDALGFLPAMQRRLEEEALAAPGGAFLIAGPADSGRTSTLHACATLLAGLGSRVVMLEDAFEARLEGVTQNVLGPGAPPDLATRVAAALAQDPDVIALGALREGCDVATALRAARCGPRVFGVVEAEDAVASLFLALAAAGAQGFVLSPLTGALAQRLVRRVCRACSEPSMPTPSQLRRLGCTGLDLAGGSFRRGRGCSRCRESGYHGRIGLFELLLLDEAGRDHLRAGQGAAELRRCSALLGPATLLEDGLVKAARGFTTLDELSRVVPRPARPRPVAEIERLLGEG